MALAAQLETIDDLPEPIKEHYEQTDDGYFRLTVDSAGTNYELEDTSGLKSALSKERQRAKDLEKMQKQFEGIDPSEVEQLRKKVEEYENTDIAQEAEKMAEQKAKSKIDQVVQKNEEKLSQVEQEKQQAYQKLQEVMIDQQAQRSLLEAGGDETTIELLGPQVKNHIRFNDNLEPEIVDKEGNVRIGDTQGNPMTLDQLAEELKGKYPVAFPGKNKSGGGTSPQGTSTSSGNNAPKGKRRSEMSSLEKAKYASQYGREALMSLPQ